MMGWEKVEGGKERGMWICSCCIMFYPPERRGRRFGRRWGGCKRKEELGGVGLVIGESKRWRRGRSI